MSEFKLQQDVFARTTRIPNCFIEQYMPKAAGEFVKIYIYLLKCVEENRAELSISKIADALEDSEKDVIRALKYWAKKGLIKLSFEDGALTSLRLSSFAEMANEPENITVSVSTASSPQVPEETKKLPEETKAFVSDTEEPEEQKAVSEKPAKKQYTPEEIAQFSQKDDITFLLYSIQKYMGHPLSGAELNTIFFFYDTLMLPPDVIEYLFEYCISKNHKNMRYIEKTAIGWADQGIRTLKAAKSMNAIFSDNCYPVLRAFGLSGRKPSRGEADYVSRWTLSYGFSLQMILEACNRTMNAIHQPSFEYADSILKRWKAAGITTPEEAAAQDEQRARTETKKETDVKTKKKSSAANQFNDFEQRTYNYAELEEKLFNA